MFAGDITDARTVMRTSWRVNEKHLLQFNVTIEADD
jgi:hypothetical protein